jgi:hypothetical protein
MRYVSGTYRESPVENQGQLQPEVMAAALRLIVEAKLE